MEGEVWRDLRAASGIGFRLAAGDAGVGLSFAASSIENAALACVEGFLFRLFFFFSSSSLLICVERARCYSD